MNTNNPSGRDPIAGASLLAKFLKCFASKLAPAGRAFSNEQFGTNTRSRISFGVLLLAALPLLTACGKEHKETIIPPGSAVLALGDSLTEGYGVKTEEAWPALLAEKTGWAVSNGGISGNTSGDALRRLPALLDQHAPVLVLVMLGGNDMLRKQPQQETVDNLAKIIAVVRANGAKPVLLATPQPSLAGAVFQHLSAPDFYRELAAAQQVPLIEDAMADVLSDPQLKVDQLHPNAAGHALLAEKIVQELKKMGFAPY